MTAWQTEIANYLASGLPVRSKSILDDGHVFWFGHGEAEGQNFLIINRNGNFVRAFKVIGGWELAPRMHEDTLFERIRGARTWPDLKMAVQLSSLGDANRERCTFLPRKLTPNGWKRQMMVRNRCFTFHGRGDDGFVLEAEGGNRSPVLGGKPWESTSAVKWAIEQCSVESTAFKSNESVIAGMRMQEAMGAIEELEIYGMF